MDEVVVKQKMGVYTGGKKGEHVEVDLGCFFF